MEEAQPLMAGWTDTIQMTRPILQQKLGMAAFVTDCSQGPCSYPLLSTLAREHLLLRHLVLPVYQKTKLF